MLALTNDEKKVLRWSAEYPLQVYITIFPVSPLLSRSFIANIQPSMVFIHIGLVNANPYLALKLLADIKDS